MIEMQRSRLRLALFDLDHTLLPLDSDYEWGEFTIRIGWNDPVEFARRNDEFYAHYQAGTLDVHDYVRFATEAVRLRGQACSCGLPAPEKDATRGPAEPVPRWHWRWTASVSSVAHTANANGIIFKPFQALALIYKAQKAPNLGANYSPTQAGPSSWWIS